MLSRLLLSALLLTTVGALQARTGQERLRGMLEIGLDAGDCYRVRDLFLEREDIKLYFTDGYLIFAEPYDGREIAALFIADQPSDSGELVLIPPNASERQSALQFTGQSVINESFRSALMLFTDDTAAVLRKALADSPSSKPDPDAGIRLAARWSPVLRNILEGVSLRLLTDIVSRLPTADGLFAAAVGGGRLGRFDIVFDPTRRRQVSVGQSVSRSGSSFYETWVEFPARSYRQDDTLRVGPRDRLENYDIEATIGQDLTMEVVARADFVPGTDRYQAFTVALSRRLRVQELLIDGEPADFLQVRQASTSGPRLPSDAVFFTPPNPPAAAGRYRLEFRYRGQVISRAGDGVFFVSNRAEWYPTAERTFSDFRLAFHYPTELDLVATGRRVSESSEDGVRTAIFVTESAARLAGFNLGRYAATERPIGDYTVEVRANRNVEARLRPKAPIPLYIPVPSRRRSRMDNPGRVVVRPTTPSPPSPADRIDAVADHSAEAFQYFLEKFGPAPTSTIVISPIPGDFGQGFPGLVYASTLSYLDPNDLPLRGMSPDERIFYSKLMLPHEISHQWWGNTVGAASRADSWILESLATYSSLLFVESREGVSVRDRILADFKRRLLEKNDDGKPVESAGPLVLGERLWSSHFPSAYRIVLYEKGAWVIHMLRAALGDEDFFSLLRNLTARYQAQMLTVEDFRREAAELTPAGRRDPQLRDFFDQWVYRTGVPRFSVKWKQNRGRVTGELRRQDTPERFDIPVPMRLEMVSGETLDWTVHSDDEVTEFEISSAANVARLLIDPDRTLLAVID